MLVDFREGILDFISFEKFIWQTTVGYMYVLYELCFLYQEKTTKKLQL